MLSMRRHLLSLSLLLSISSVSSVLALEILPPAVDSRTYIRVRTFVSYCIPVTEVAVNGSTIVVTVSAAPKSACIPETIAAATADVGLLAPGVYQVVVNTKEDASGIDHGSLIVRDAESGIVVSPVGLPSEGKRTVQVFTGRPLDVASVLFDGVPAALGEETGRMVVVTPPPHAPGTVDVVVTDEAGTRTAVAAFTYFDPAAPPDRQIFEPVLFPIAYDGGGIFGSQWTTENVIGTDNTLVRFRQPVPVRHCDGKCSEFDWSATLAAESDSGVLLWAVWRRLPAGADDEFRVASRVADTSRPRSGGTSLPVAREDDFRRRFAIAAVPLARGGERALLRIYALGTLPFASVRMALPDGEEIFRLVFLRPADGFSYGALDLAPLLLLGGSRASITVTGEESLGWFTASAKVWGVVTVTNNTTQEVTALWPQ
jgi:hypothetical protein